MNKYQQERELQMPQGEVLPYRIDHFPHRREHFDLGSDGTVRLQVLSENRIVLSGEVVWLCDETPYVYPLELRHRDASYDTWESVPIPPHAEADYYFRLQTISGQALLGATGLQASIPKEARFKGRTLPVIEVPEWSVGACIYQIFPDRFCRSGEASVNDERWDAPPTVDGFKGGNLRGISEQLDYLKDLGVDAIYLNPIFSSPSNHRYDTNDFYRIDPRLGDEEDLRFLVEKAHSMGLRLILDGVFNHVSDTHPFFTDVVERGEDSPYWNWFSIHRWPVTERSDDFYRAWWGHGHLPQLDLGNETVQEYFTEVGKYWVSELDIDGWRIDVAGEISNSFWRRFREGVRSVKRDAYLVAEVWGDGTSFLQGDTFDATMNYPFRRTILEFLTGRLDSHLAASYLQRLYLRTPRDLALSQYNLLGSHDVSRVRSDLGGDLELVELSLALQCAYPGAMAVYYGDELGLTGEGDPGCRGGFPWGSVETSTLRKRFRQLTNFRKATPALLRGDFRCHARGHDELILERWHGCEHIYLTVDRKSRQYEWSSNSTTS